MYNLLLLLPLLSLALSDDVPEPTGVYHYSQKVDHYSYNPAASQTFLQRLFEYDKHWHCGPNGTVGPLFVYTGNEGPIESFYYNTGFMFEIAPMFGALILFVEHRLAQLFLVELGGPKMILTRLLIDFNNNDCHGFLSTLENFLV